MILLESTEQRIWPDETGLDVWRIHLALPPAAIDELQTHLSPEERSTANRFRFEQDRLRYTTAHAGMRLILAACLGCQPQDLTVRRDTHGKPMLLGPTGSSTPAFNLSHSGQEALLAVGRQQYVGVDIEQERPMTDLQGLAHTVLSPQERSLFTALNPSQQLEYFFRIWTCKEATVKATGAGLATPLQEVQIQPLEPAQHGRFEAVGAMPDDRRLYGSSFSPIAGYRAAAVTEVPGIQITWHDWPEDPL